MKQKFLIVTPKALSNTYPKPKKTGENGSWGEVA